MPRDFKKLLTFYRRQVYDDLMPYWMRQIDRAHGGVLNCLSNRGDRLLHDHKFVWSQGRWAYQTAQAYEAAEGEVSEATRRTWLETSEATARFLMRHARLPNGNCAFVLSRDGRPIRLNEDGTGREAREGEGYDYSIAADQFAYYGVANYARVARDRAAYEWAKDLYRSCERRIRDGTARSDYPYPWPKGYRTHGRPMGLLEYSQSLGAAAAAFGDAAFARELDDVGAACVREIRTVFAQPDGLVLEAVGEDGRPVDTLLGRYFNPGHTIEDMWFVIHYAMRHGDRETIDWAARVVRATIERGWDREFGGIPQFSGRKGGPPEGRVEPELENHPMIVKLRTLWDMKLWWPHSEALYALLLIYEQTGEKWALEEYERFHEYVFRTFPNPDKSVGEWIQIRNRRGEPEEAVVALPVKDPMHIVRAFLHAIRALKRLVARSQ